jgi:hypothetical protein
MDGLAVLSLKRSVVESSILSIAGGLGGGDGCLFREATLVALLTVASCGLQWA